jgi:hypothetical protein
MRRLRRCHAGGPEVRRVMKTSARRGVCGAGLAALLGVALWSAPARAESEIFLIEPITWETQAAGMVGLSSFFAAGYIWAYFAWYKGRSLTEEIIFHDEGGFGLDTYAGGADKLGHMFSNYTIARGSMQILRGTGWGDVTSSIVSTGLTLSFFTMLEIKDGYHRGFGFSWGDMVANATGNVLAQLTENVPVLDAMFDVRLEYQPTPEFVQMLVENGAVDAAEDYSGQTFMLVYHLGSLPVLTEELGLDWPRYFDLALGFQALNYLPRLNDPNRPPQQRIFVGMSINLQQILREVFYPREEVGRWEPKKTKGSAEVAEFLSEVFTVPNTTVRVIEIERIQQLRQY